MVRAVYLGALYYDFKMDEWKKNEFYYRWKRVVDALSNVEMKIYESLWIK